MGQHVPATPWAEWIEEQWDSGLTVAEFCDVVGTTTNPFYRWRRRLSAEREQGGTESTALNESPAAAFHHSNHHQIDLPC